MPFGCGAVAPVRGSVWPPSAAVNVGWVKVASDSRTVSAPQAAASARSGSIAVVGATALGVGGMMGAGLYTLVGLPSKSAGSFVPVAFVIAGVGALFSVYSYARLGARFPSRGGAAEFLLEEFGEGLVCGH